MRKGGASRRNIHFLDTARVYQLATRRIRFLDVLGHVPGMLGVWLGRSLVDCCWTLICLFSFHGPSVCLGYLPLAHMVRFNKFALGTKKQLSLSLSLSPLILYLLLFPFADRSNPLPQLPVAPACNQPFAVASRSLSRSHPVSALVRFASLPDEILAAMALFNGEAPGCAAVALPNRAAGDGRHAQAALVGEQATERLADTGMAG